MSRALYDPVDERSSCGVGFITRKDGRPSHDVITMAHESLCAVPHHGGMDADDAADYVATMRKEKRYVRDVY